MDPANVPNPPLPDSPAGTTALPPARRVTVGKIGLTFSCVALFALAAMVLLHPG